MRRHGWQLPYHPLQIVAMAVFFALVFAFYVFLAPFVGSKLLEIAVLAMYSSTVLVVFALYVWCVAVNPADNGLRHQKRCEPSTPAKSRAATSTVSNGVDGKDVEMSTTKQSNQHRAGSLASFALCSDLFCNSDRERSSNAVEMLYCSLCKVEISIDSKHCRVCDKCIDGFDHHCRWLNNCVGRKNYKDFVALMVSGIAMLILQWAVGLWILVHCFLKITLFKGLIVSKLGDSFPFIAYVSVVALCTLLAMAATYPLTQLFLFHLLLIRKGISTYDYIVAMREQDSKAIGDSLQSSSASPNSSIGTTPSVGISAGALQGKAWCTPPRLLLDREQGIHLPERLVTVKDTSSGPASKMEHDSKKTVKLDPWALAALNKDDIMRATTAAKKQSSILRPVQAKHDKAMMHRSNGSMSSPGDLNREYDNSTPIANSSNARADTLKNLEGQSMPATSFVDQQSLSTTNFDGDGNDYGDIIQLARTARRMLNPLQMEAMNAFKSSHAFSGTMLSSPDSCGTSDDAHTSQSPNQASLFGSHGQSSHVPSFWRYNARGSESTESDGDASSPCTPIRQMVYGAHKGAFRS